MTAITVVTPWHNCQELIPAYSRALDYGLVEVDRLVIVDNGSDPPIRIGAADLEIHLPTNVGFSPACNRGLEEVETEAVLFLNNDVVMTSANWLEQMRSQMRSGVLVGATLSTAPHTAVDGRVQPYIEGWCIGGMAEEIRALGGWDESLEEPSYYGDNILSALARARGMKLVQVPVGLRHLGNYTTRRVNVDGVSGRNRVRYEQVVRSLNRVAA